MIDLVCVQFKVGKCALPTKGLVIRVQPNFVILKKKTYMHTSIITRETLRVLAATFTFHYIMKAMYASNINNNVFI